MENSLTPTTHYSHIPENPDIKFRFLTLFLYDNKMMIEPFLWQKKIRQRFLWVSCPFNWSLRIQSITVFPLTVLKSFRPKWFYLWAAGMLHWSDKNRFKAILAHTVIFSDFPFSCPCLFLFWWKKANFLKFLINYFKTFHSFVPVPLYLHLNKNLIIQIRDQRKHQCCHL